MEYFTFDQFSAHNILLIIGIIFFRFYPSLPEKVGISKEMTILISNATIIGNIVAIPFAYYTNSTLAILFFPLVIVLAVLPFIAMPTMKKDIRTLKNYGTEAVIMAFYIWAICILIVGWVIELSLGAM